MSVRVRYAPSPTGLQHIGGVRTALFDYLFARASGGSFVLRVEDTDRERFSQAALDDIYDSLAWLGINWDEGPDVGGDYGPYVQSQRTELYRKYADQLVESGHAYLAYDTAEELAAAREEQGGKGGGYDRKFRDMQDSEKDRYREQGIPAVVRFKVPLHGRTRFTDIVLGDVEWANEDINPDPILLKSDGFPTYHLANVVDDHLMEITHILRAQEWIPSAPLHILLYEALGWQPPAYVHLPLVTGDDGKKLSKRHGATGLGEFRARGYLPDAIINYVARLGWSLDDKQEIFSREDLERLFSLEKISKAPAVFDYKKLEWLNGHYIRELSVEELYKRTLPFVVDAGVVNNPPTEEQETTLRGAMMLVQERLKYLKDTPDLVRFLFQEPGDIDAEEMIPKKLDAAATLVLLRAVEPMVVSIPDCSDEENEHAFRAKAEELETKLGNLLMPLRVAVTGSRVSPPLFESIRLLGSDVSTRRVGRAMVILETIVRQDG